MTDISVLRLAAEICRINRTDKSETEKEMLKKQLLEQFIRERQGEV